jgi:hypothetical protein
MEVVNGRHRGQLTIIGIIMTIIGVIIYAVLYPVLDGIISDAGFTGTDALLAHLIPTVILLGLLATPIIYLQVSRQQNY